MTDTPQEIEARLEDVREDLDTLYQGRVRDWEANARRLEETEEGAEQLAEYARVNGVDLAEAYNALVGTPPERPGKTVAAAEGAPTVDGVPLWEEATPPIARPRTPALAGGDGFEEQVKVLTGRGLTRDQAVTRLCNTGQVRF